MCSRYKRTPTKNEADSIGLEPASFFCIPSRRSCLPLPALISVYSTISLQLVHPSNAQNITSKQQPVLLLLLFFFQIAARTPPCQWMLWICTASFFIGTNFTSVSYMSLFQAYKGRAGICFWKAVPTREGLIVTKKDRKPLSISEYKSNKFSIRFCPYH